MTDMLQGNLFDYAALDTEIATSLQLRVQRINGRNRRMAQDAWDNGKDLYEAQQELSQHGYGTFIKWAEQETGLSKRTVYNLINVYTTFDCAKFTQSNIALSALYYLASPSTPEPARNEVFEIAANGPINFAQVRQIVNEHKPGPQFLEESEIEQRMCPYCGVPYLGKVVGGVSQCPACNQLHAYSGPRDTETYGPYSTETADSVKADHQLINTSTSNEWYTPAKYVDAVHTVMGGIDLDPASNPIANKNVRATQYYTIDDDGYTKDWEGRVFLNPPYGTTDGESNQARWSRRLMKEYREGRVTEAVLLVNAVPGNQWFAPLWAFPICFPDHRIRFYNAEIDAGQPTHSNALVYFGKNMQRFVDVFSSFGVVAGRLRVEGDDVSIFVEL